MEPCLRQYVVRALVSLALVAGVASPARAFGWEWLEELSGPGPWRSVFYEQKLNCWFDPPKAGIEPTVVSPGGSGPCVWPRGSKDDKQPKPDRHWRSRLAAVGVGTRFGWTERNDLSYPEGTEDIDTKVRLFQVYAFADMRLPVRPKVLHLGAAFGAARFWGRAIDEPLWRPTLETRLSVKLFRTLKTGSVDLRVGRRWFLGRLTAENFGANAGSFKVDDDGVWFAGMVFDFN